jgi:DNA-binding response OmpR family regulator
MDNNKLILVVEDDPHIVRAVALRLKAAGYRVLEAHDGQAGLDLAKKALPHIIVADIRMPVMDGFTMLAKLRAQTGTCLIPAVMFSANIAEAAKAQAMELGVSYFIEKPYSFATLMQAVEATLKPDRPVAPAPAPKARSAAVQ